MSIDKYYSRRYHPSQYNCLHFAREVWLDTTGEDIGDLLVGLLVGPDDREVKREHVQAFKRLDKPKDPCLVLMMRQGCAPHVGVYMRRRVLHIHEAGVEFQPVDVASRAFTSVRYYECKR